MLSQKISLRNALAQIYHSYYSTESDNSQLSEFTQSKIAFFNDFQRRKKLITCRIENISTIPKLSYHRAYTVYQIDILTEQLFFSVQKRYSEFEKLHKRIKKFKGLQMKFPKKTYWQSGTEISVTSQRISLLNEFISQILQLSDEYSDIKYMFYDFLGLWDKYVEKGVDINNTDYEYFLANTQNIYIEILKLNENPKTISSILQRIRKLIFDYKIKLSLEITRQIFFGIDQDKKGLIQFTLTIENQYVAIECLKLITDLLDPQLNKTSQLFLKALQNCSSKRLIVKEKQLLQNINFKKLYFEILKKYHSKPTEKDLKYIFNDQKEIYEEYLFWLKGFKPKQEKKSEKVLSTVPLQTYDQIESKRSFNKIKEKIQNLPENNSLQGLEMLQGEQITLIGQNNEGLLYEGTNYLGFRMQFDKEQRSKIQALDRQKWATFGEEIKNKYTDVVTKTLNYKQQRRFKFNKNQQLNNSQITLEPIHTDHFDDCFFEFSEVIQKESVFEVVQIIYFCHNNSHEIKQFLKNKLGAFWTEKLKN